MYAIISLAPKPLKWPSPCQGRGDINLTLRATQSISLFAGPPSDRCEQLKVPSLGLDELLCVKMWPPLTRSAPGGPSGTRLQSGGPRQGFWWVFFWLFFKCSFPSDITGLSLSQGVFGEYVGLHHEKFRPIKFHFDFRNSNVVCLCRLRFLLSLVEFKEYQCPMSIVTSISGPLWLLLRPMHVALWNLRNDNVVLRKVEV